jgi:acyl-CoA thioester hydrolase
MQRVKVELPDKFDFFTIIQTRITDMNYGGHLGNDCFLSLIHEARIQFLQHYDYTELNFEGTSLIMADVALEFKHEIVYNNKIKIWVKADGFDKIGFDIFYLLEIIDNDNNKLAGKAKTGMLCFDYSTKKITAIPNIAKEKLLSAI